MIPLQPLFAGLAPERLARREVINALLAAGGQAEGLWCLTCAEWVGPECGPQSHGRPLRVRLPLPAPGARRG